MFECVWADALNALHRFEVCVLAGARNALHRFGVLLETVLAVARSILLFGCLPAPCWMCSSAFWQAPKMHRTSSESDQRLFWPSLVLSFCLVAFLLRAGCVRARFGRRPKCIAPVRSLIRDCSGRRSFDQNAGFKVVQAPTLIASFLGLSMHQ